MSSLVPIQHSPIAVMGDRLARALLAQPLPATAAHHPRSMFIVRMLAGAESADCFVGHCLALPSDLSAAVVHCGGPAGPSFKAHNPEFSKRFDAGDTDLLAELINFRLAHPERHMFATFDPECLEEALQAVDIFEATLGVVVDIIFVTSRTEATPKFVRKLQSKGAYVIHAHAATLRPNLAANVVNYPNISPMIENLYATGDVPLRKLIEGSSPGVLIAFEIGLVKFAEALAEHLHG